MALVCVTSPKGGVGKTTCVASLAYGIKALGFRVVVIDFDWQNSLRLHFGMPLNDGRGFAARAVSCQDWQELVLTSPSGVQILPYGVCSEERRAALDEALATPGFLARRLEGLVRQPGLILIADLPPGPSPALKAVAALADLRLTVLLADSVSMAQLRRVENDDFYPPDMPEGSRHFYVLNQIDPRRRLNAEITEFMRERHGDELIGVIHLDEAVPEANAGQRSVFNQAPSSQAALDLQHCVRKVMRTLAHDRGEGLPPSSKSPGAP